ncbi:hypothetical protein L0F63_003476 [Massospora cicadina]|nr:hypothetical protein L0F63_003476 [Massospora cicadina]
MHERRFGALLPNKSYRDKPRRAESKSMVQVPRGWKRGRTVLVKAAGDQLPGGTFQDIKFEIVLKPHDVFRVEGNDLVMDVELSFSNPFVAFRRRYIISAAAPSNMKLTNVPQMA